MCSHCLTSKKDIEQEFPEDELWELYQAAYVQYRSEVMNGDKKYDRFVNDFISYNIFIGSSDSSQIKEHIRNVSALYELLTCRIDLIKEYFTLPTFDKEAYFQMNHRFNTTDFVEKLPAIIGVFNDQQLGLITHFANEAKLFVSKVDVKTMHSFFACSLKKSLFVNHSAPVLLLLNVLSICKFIDNRWKQMVADNGLLAPTRTMKPFSRTALSSRLYDAVKHQASPLQEPYGSLIKKLQETM